MTWKIESGNYKLLSDKDLEDLGMKLIRSTLTGEPLGREGWKVLGPESHTCSDGVERLFLTSGSSFGSKVENRWASLDGKGEIKRDPFMTAWCRNHTNCNEQKCTSSYPGCHGGKPGVSLDCECGVYAWSRLPDAMQHGGEENMPVIVRLAHLGPNIRTDMQRMLPRFSDDKDSGLVYTGPMGVRSYQAHITGIIHPSIPDWFDSESPKVKSVISKLSMAYGNIPILDGKTEGRSAAQVLAGSLKI